MVSGQIGVVENEGVVGLLVLVVVGFLLLVEGLVVGPVLSQGVSVSSSSSFRSVGSWYFFMCAELRLYFCPC